MTQMQLQPPLTSTTTLQKNYFKRGSIKLLESRRVSRSVSVNAGNSQPMDLTDLTATKQKLKEACRTKATPPDQVLQYLIEVENASKASSHVKSRS
jgi:hypothetical protein